MLPILYFLISIHTLPDGNSCTTNSFESDAQQHIYRFKAYADTIIHGRVEQLGVDVTTELQHPDFERKVDTFSNRGGDETFWLHIPGDGELVITISEFSSEPKGYYQLHLETILNPSSQQLLAVKADQLAALDKSYFYAEELAIRLDAGIIGDTLRTLGRLTDDLIGRRHYAKGLALLREHEHMFAEEHAPWNHILHMKMALLQVYLRRLDEAEQTYRKAYDLAKSQSPEYAGRIANDLGRMLYNNGKIYRALNWYEKARSHYQVCFCGDLTAKVAINTAEAYGFLGQTEKARQALQAASAILQAREPCPDLALALTELGWVDYLDGKHQQALVNFEVAEQLNRELGHLYQLAGTLDRMGSTLRAMDRLDEARARHAEALALFSRIGAVADVAEAKANLARDYFEAGAKEQAATLCEEILPFLREHRPTRMSTLLALAARIAHEQGHLQKADALYVEALEVVEQLYQESQSRRLRRTLSDTRYKILADYSVFLWERNEVARAFLVVDGTRARILHQRLTIDAPDGSGLDHPLGLARSQKLDLQQTRSKLDADTLILSYALHEERSLVFALDSEGLTAYPLPPAADVTQAAERVISAVKRSHLASGRAGWQRYSQQLADMILKPLGDQLHKKRLVIIPDGALHYVPFAALPSPLQQGPLIWHHELSSLPSLGFGMALRELADKREQAPKTLAIFADPILNLDDSRLHHPKPELSSSDNYLQRLTQRGIQDITALLQPDQVWQNLGETASLEAFLKTTWPNFRYLHLDSHGVLHPQPEFSGLILSRYNRNGEPLNNELRTLDLLGTQLHLELVTLSACSTATGKVLSGEGMWGLTAAFLEAGSQRVIASLWDVREKPTAELFHSFYRHLIHHRNTPGEALRAAQVELSRHPQWQAPFYWSAWVLQGEWQ